MKSRLDPRSFILRTVLGLVFVAAAVFVSPFFLRHAYASDGDVTCTASCNGKTCTGNQPYCVCTCHWLWGTPVCNCSQPVDQQPTST
jgi:hypothetical protein